MVRLKHRYLLLNILYPSSANGEPISGKRKEDGIIPDTVAFHAPSSDALTPQLLLRLVREGVAELFGDYGAGMVGGSLQVKYLSPSTSTAILRVTRSHYRLVWAALTYTTRLPRPIEQDCVIQVVRVSGTIRKSEEEAIRRAKIGIMRAMKEGGLGKGGGILDELMGRGHGEDGVEDGGMGLGMGGGIEDEEDEGEDEDEE